MMPAPSWPPSNMIVTHAATQVQLAPVGDGLQAYFVGTDGTGHPGPYIASFSSLASQHPAGGRSYALHRQQPGHRQADYDLLPAVRNEDSRQHLLPGHTVRHQQALRIHRRLRP